MMKVGNHDFGEVVVNIGKARPKVIVASMALPKRVFAPRTAIFRDTNKKPEIYISVIISESFFCHFQEEKSISRLCLSSVVKVIIILNIVFLSVCFFSSFGLWFKSIDM